MQPKRILMCKAEHFGVNFEINPWMHKDNQPSREKALEQQDDIIKTLQDLGHQIVFIAPEPECPDMCFTANSAVVRGDLAFLGNLPTERQPEHPHYEQWFTSHGFSVHTTKYRFGGGGDALWVGDLLIAGYGPATRRATDLEVHKELRDVFGVKIVSVQTTDERFYDLDMAIAVINPNLIAYCKEVLDQESVMKIQVLDNVEAIEVSLEDALGFGCNLISDGKNILISDRAPGLIGELRNRGFNVLPHSIGQFMLSGGGIRCLGLDLPHEGSR
jgi:N-dimethylarginine dimethylaminohydrolase